MIMTMKSILSQKYTQIIVKSIFRYAKTSKGEKFIKQLLEDYADKHSPLAAEEAMYQAAEIISDQALFADKKELAQYWLIISAFSDYRKSAPVITYPVPSMTEEDEYYEREFEFGVRYDDVGLTEDDDPYMLEKYAEAIAHGM